MRNRILIVDDEMAVRYSFERAFGEEYSIVTAENGMDALHKVENEKPDLVLMDIKMPVLNGIDALKKMKGSYPNIPIIMMTAFGDTETAIEAMKDGAYDYVTKPFENSELRTIVEKGLASARLLAEASCSRIDDTPSYAERIVGKSNAILNVCKLIGQVAHTNVPVLLVGESGVGKELVARAIYHHSNRKNKPFIAVNCAALPENLVESELFGHEHGAFTGADKRRIGRFEQCNGGTIFLDEIGDMSPMTQSKVLRVLQDSTFERLGGSQPVKVDVRVIAATNKNLPDEVKAGHFRNDLYHRLNVVSLSIPPLRERREDIPSLAEYFIKKANIDTGHNIKGIQPDALMMLENYSWTGNVRELENTIRRAVVISKGNVIGNEDLLFEKTETTGSIADAVNFIAEKIFLSGINDPYNEVIAEVEKALIKKALELTKGNQVKASSLLGITRVTLRKKIEEYNLNVST
ncbi:MAG: sigma-54 dependent transcriptional regulator [Thermodesulfovibrionales bacterium]|nr:sigma-54 dependent transcriptional regulator [Thermodesulfovibrionales bacterium]